MLCADMEVNNSGGIMKKTVIAMMVVLGLPGMAMAGGDAAAGKARAAICAACHGANGKATIPTYPNLAGQNEAYLANSLKDYKNKKRNGPQALIMQPQASMLSDQDIANLAAYFSSL